MRYIPLDELLARPHVRLLRALRWQGWATLDDLALALDLPDCSENRDVRVAYSGAMRYLAQSGRVEADRSAWPNRYRLTPAGREWLRAALSVPGPENAATGTLGPISAKGAA